MARLEERRSADLLEHLEVVHVRHPDVEHDEIEVRLADERQDMRPVLRLADHLEASVLVERAADAVEHQPVVVCEDMVSEKLRSQARSTSVPQASLSR